MEWSFQTAKELVAALRTGAVTSVELTDEAIARIERDDKESYNIAGLPTTWGMPPHRNYMPAEDAVQVSRLKSAGAVVLGKTNVPFGLQDIQSSTRSTAPPTTRGITIARRADPPADQRRRWRPDSARCPSAPTSPARCAPPRISAASTR